MYQMEFHHASYTNETWYLVRLHSLLLQNHGNAVVLTFNRKKVCIPNNKYYGEHSLNTYMVVSLDGEYLLVYFRVTVYLSSHHSLFLTKHSYTASSFFSISS